MYYVGSKLYLVSELYNIYKDFKEYILSKLMI